MANIKAIILIAAAATTGSALAASQEVPITGTVQSKCSIFTDRAGVYGSPTPHKLSTEPSDGGVKPIIRYDVAQAAYYTAKISHPDSFSSSPSLNDSVTWTGATTVKEVGDTAMSDYESNKVTYNNVTEFNLTAAGTTWFTVDSTAAYGNTKSLPAGTYTTVVVAECIAN